MRLRRRPTTRTCNQAGAARRSALRYSVRMGDRFPARLHGLLAAASPLAVILRRGPASAVCSMLWDRRDDTFQTGQWLRARIYERRCDLSPDGRHLIYFARGGRRHAETKGTWTAISRAPWLKAVALYGKGDCWQGGGLFTSATRYWLNGCGHFLVRDSSGLEQDCGYRPPGPYGGECPSVYFPRLQRDGWTLRERLNAGITSQLTIFEKALPHGWTLRKYAHADVGPHDPGHGCYWDEHEIESADGKQRFDRKRWEWAERDGGDVVWAEGGCLHRAAFGAAGPGGTRVLLDANGMTFEARVAPY